jgi:hypothetical protein
MEMPAYWLPRPAMNLTQDDTAALEAIFDARLALGRGDWLDETLPIPKWQFLCWLADEKGLLLHGTGNPDIAAFEPRQSNDVSEFGNRKAVYAASDGLWPMFFAVVDRANYSMTIVNAAIRVESPAGEISQPYYFFSMTDTALAQQPWRDGVIYILPRDGFEEQAGDLIQNHRIHTNHWANLQPVRPLAKLKVAPDDFPFLAQVRGQDDALLAERFEANPDGFPWVE